MKRKLIFRWNPITEKQSAVKSSSKIQCTWLTTHHIAIPTKRLVTDVNSESKPERDFLCLAHSQHQLAWVKFKAAAHKIVVKVPVFATVKSVYSTFFDFFWLEVSGQVKLVLH